VRNKKYAIAFTSIALPDTLIEMTTHLEDPKVAIVHQLPFTRPEPSFAGVLDSVSDVFAHVCSVCMCVCMQCVYVCMCSVVWCSVV